MNCFSRLGRKQKYKKELVQLCQEQLIRSSSARNALGMALAYKQNVSQQCSTPAKKSKRVSLSFINKSIYMERQLK